MFSDEQYMAARERSAVSDRSVRGKISVTGTDRAGFLHALLTNDIARLKPGTGTYAAYLTPQGRMISDMRVVETGQEILLDVEPTVVEGLAQRLEGLIFSEDVQVRNVTREFGEGGVHGPLAAQVLERATGIPAARLESLSAYDNLHASGSAVTVVRDDMFGIMGFEVYSPVSEFARLLNALLGAGAVLLDDDTAEVLRIEAGRPRFGIDMDTDTIPLEAGIEDRAISLTKGCYVGQEVIVRVLHRGHGRVARKLVALDIRADAVPARGDAILAGDGEVGRVTSAAFSPESKRPRALGYVPRAHMAEGTEVRIDAGGHILNARVCQLGK